MTLQEFISEWNNDSTTVTVQTSGSTGQPKIMHVEKQRMEASARLTCEFLGLRRGDTALLCMPLDYIAGKMVVVRSLVWGMRLVSVNPSGRPLSGLSEAPVFAAMTPMQVYNSLQSDKQKLKAIKHLIIGGGAVDDTIAKELRTFETNVWSTYGMTETLSHIAMRRLSGSGADGWYTPLRGVSVGLSADGCLVVDAPAVCAQTLRTNDLAELHEDGKRFKILGRKDNVIDSGGIKIRIEDVEGVLSSHVPLPFVITKCKDKRLGEAVTLLYEGSAADSSLICGVCKQLLPKYWQPKHYFAVSKIPLTGSGKPARAEIAAVADLISSENRP